jgi:hypothetical protein
MKAFFFSLLLASYPFLSQAQIEVSITDFPVKYDTVRYSNGTDLDLDFFSTGADFTWDFGNLNADSQTLLNHLSADDADQLIQNSFGMISPPAYRASYYLPATDLPIGQFGAALPVNIENLYRFFRRTNTSLNIIGLSLVIEGFGLSARSDTIEIAYELPMTYQNSWQSVGYTKLDFSVAFPAQFAQYRQRSSEVDGYGSLTTPYGTFDVLRVHHLINEVDSLLIEFNGVVTPVEIPVTTHEYEWWTTAQKGPLLRVVTNEVGGNEQVTLVQFRDNYREELVAGLNEHTAAGISVFPNPVKEKFMINVQEEGVATVYALDGKAMETLSLKAGETTIHTSDWPAGTYIVYFRSLQGSVSMQRIVK